MGPLATSRLVHLVLGRSMRPVDLVLHGSGCGRVGVALVPSVLDLSNGLRRVVRFNTDQEFDLAHIGQHVIHQAIGLNRVVPRERDQSRYREWSRTLWISVLRCLPAIFRYATLKLSAFDVVRIVWSRSHTGKGWARTMKASGYMLIEWSVLSRLFRSVPNGLDHATGALRLVWSEWSDCCFSVNWCESTQTR